MQTAVAPGNGISYVRFSTLSSKRGTLFTLIEASLRVLCVCNVSSNKFSRIDYVQVGLTSKNAFKLVRKNGNQVEVVVGDHSGSLHIFALGTDSNQVETIVKTLPGPNARINCVEVFSGESDGNASSIRILSASGSSTIKGFNRKGKPFFSLELNNLTEPIKLFKTRWPHEIYVVGQYIYNSYLINAETINNGDSGGIIGSAKNFSLPTGNSSSKSSNSAALKSRHYYVCPEKINDFIMLEDKFNRRTVPVLACQDRLLRILKDSTCNFEIEICGIPSAVQIVPKFGSITAGLTNTTIESESRKQKSRKKKNATNHTNATPDIEEVHLGYGTLDGKIALVTLQFIDKTEVEPLHHWQVPTNAIKQPVTCMYFSETNAEFYVGRSDGTIEVWRLNETIDDDSVQSVDLTIAPTLIESYNCGESVTNIVPVSSANDREPDSLLLCSTFTGLVFGLVKHGEALTQMRQLNPHFLIVGKENSARIEALKNEIEQLENRLEIERTKYHQQTSKSNDNAIESSNLSALPFFTINDSFVLHNDASYVLMLEAEVPMDVIVFHCDIGLDLIDCERNSAVISFNEPDSASDGAILAVFRCQSNTTRLEIRLRPVEGQHGTLSVYVVSRITPRSCQTRTYTIQPLSLHKRQYSNRQIDDANTLKIIGTFSVSDAHTWLRRCVPEIPEKLTTAQPGCEDAQECYHISTMTNSILICNYAKGAIRVASDNVSTISILKDFLTREATRQSIPIEIDVRISAGTISAMLRHLYPRIKSLILDRQRHDLYEAIDDLQSSDASIATQLLVDLNLIDRTDVANSGDGGSGRSDHNGRANSGKPPSAKQSIGSASSSSADRQDVLIGLDRIYGIITDLFIDYHKLKGNPMAGVLQTAKQKLPEMITLIESTILDSIEYGKDSLDVVIENDDGQDGSGGDRDETTITNTNTTIFVERLYHFWDMQT